MNIVIRPPLTEEMEAYFHLRWKVLRKPWGQPLGSEQDSQEGSCYQLAAFNDKKEVVACGRLQLNSPTEAQIRFVAVDPAYQGLGAGKLIMASLEANAKESGAAKVILQARENTVPFYLSCGYSIVEKTFLLFNEIQHFLMEKSLD
jgi:N-acetylglutamate synthase-like GNAT family acetyltransferase